MSRSMNTKPCVVLRSSCVLFYAFDFRRMWYTTQNIYNMYMWLNVSSGLHIFMNLLTYKVTNVYSNFLNKFHLHMIKQITNECIIIKTEGCVIHLVFKTYIYQKISRKLHT